MAYRLPPRVLLTRPIKLGSKWLISRRFLIQSKLPGVPGPDF